jgi:hypothetical protein
LFLRVTNGRRLFNPQSGLRPREPHSLESQPTECTICGTTGGYRQKHARSPVRNSLEPFGIEGVACRVCYNRIRRRAMQARPIPPDHPSRLRLRREEGLID